MKVCNYSIYVFLFWFSISLSSADDLGPYGHCVLLAMAETKQRMEMEYTTVKEVEAKCTEYKESYSIKTHENYDHNKFIMAFKPNYILPYSVNSLGYNSKLYQQHFNDPSLELDNVEVMFQFSIKLPLAVNLFNKNIDLIVAYTNRSFWQLYNDKISAPFRDTNHEPEMWIQRKNRIAVFGFRESTKSIGISHQSNGRGGLLSRSWNRVYAQYIAEQKAILLSLKTWIRVTERGNRDDNSDLIDFLGHSELQAKYKYLDNIFSVMSRNNLESGFTKGAVELAWSFPIGLRKDLKGYVQVFSGYGESLIDYNNRINRVGLGVLISDWM